MDRFASARMIVGAGNLVMKRLAGKFRQGSGKLRRLVLARLGKNYVRRQEELRKGTCKRCGACCKLLFNCPFLSERADGSYSCRIHNRRPENCRMFPVDHHDLRDRDVLMPNQSCGFHFPQRQERHD